MIRLKGCPWGKIILSALVCFAAVTLAAEPAPLQLPLSGETAFPLEVLSGRDYSVSPSGLIEETDSLSWKSGSSLFVSLPQGEAVWLRIPLCNTDDSGLYTLVSEIHSFYTMEWYLTSPEGFLYRQGALSYKEPYSSRRVSYRNEAFSFHLPTQENRVLYLKVQSEVLSQFSFLIMEESRFQRRLNHELRLYSFILGLFFMVIAFNFFNALISKQKSYLFYSLYVVVYSYYLINIQGLDHIFFYPRQGGSLSLFLSPLLGGLSLVLVVLFITQYFAIPRDRSWRDYLIRGMLVLGSLVFLFPVLGIPSALVFWLGNFLGFLVVLGSLIIGLHSFLKGDRAALIFLAAHGMVIAATLIYTMTFFGIIPNTSLTRYIHLFGGVFQVIFLSFGLSYRFRLLQTETVKAQEMAVEALRSAAVMKDKFLANTSHELRTPLIGIIGITEALISGNKDELSPSVQEDLALLRSSGYRLSHLINDILDFSSLKQNSLVLKPQPVPLGELLDHVLAHLKGLAPADSIQWELELPETLPLLYADPERVKQILFNLLGNAQKFSKKGIIRVSAEGPVPGSSAPVMVIRVDDQGPGIPEDMRERVFLDFETLEGVDTRQYGGTGLGLSITKYLVEIQGGSIRVDESPWGGARLEVTLPVADSEALDVSQNPLESSSLSEPLAGDDAFAEGLSDSEIPFLSEPREKKSLYHILVVDDEPVNRKVIGRQLENRGFRVTLAEEGPTALEVVQGDKPDLVLLDIMMPGMSGYEVCREIRAHFSLIELPVIILTAKRDSDGMVKGFEAGANDFIAKPVVQKELFIRILTHLQISQAARY